MEDGRVKLKRALYQYSVADGLYPPRFRWLSLTSYTFGPVVVAHDEVMTVIMRSCSKLRILSVSVLYSSEITGDSWLSQLATNNSQCLPELELFQILLHGGTRRSADGLMLDEVARRRTGLFVWRKRRNDSIDVNWEDQLWRYVKHNDSDELTREEFSLSEDVKRLSSFPCDPQYGPSLKALREGQAVPRDVTEFIMRNSTSTPAGNRRLKVDTCDLMSYFLPVPV
jgi:hypothetical protein